MLERILNDQNLHQALERVERNKGSHGIDGMPVKSLREHLLSEWPTLNCPHYTIKVCLSGKAGTTTSADF
ncbi:hypothetical protein [Alteribacillus bidgolensis]|uniref:RNA-directed DNA polymerase n=1 Tax=Alteribacillus bidgolensis TaxID=930129 RepID=A0A1G8GFK2_9BACI|nr:hypothetical protein [Alteribacillus bidgolensis]SDH93138.1 hypothetical protein SAMN05216352_103378 [Alteribacillus bidgolensis]